MRSTLRVVSIGLPDPIHLAYDMFLRQHRCELSSAVNYQELSALTTQEECEVAVLHNSLPQPELKDSARLIRQRWPHARILIVCADVRWMEDPLYDERIVPGANPEILLAAVGRLASG